MTALIEDLAAIVGEEAGIGITHDIAVPVSKIPEFVRRVSPALERRFPGIRIVIVGHFGDGNLHFIAQFGFGAWDAFPDQEAIVAEVHRLTYDIAAELGGTFSAEHGIGQYLVAEMRQYKSEVERSLMRSVKRALDPKGLFNPAKVLPQYTLRAGGKSAPRRPACIAVQRTASDSCTLTCLASASAVGCATVLLMRAASTPAAVSAASMASAR